MENYFAFKSILDQKLWFSSYYNIHLIYYMKLKIYYKNNVLDMKSSGVTCDEIPPARFFFLIYLKYHTQQVDVKVMGVRVKICMMWF